MPQISLLIKKLRLDYPSIHFIDGDNYMWSPDLSTVFYSTLNPDSPLLLHELSHGILGHTDYSKDIELLQLERSAWEETKKLAKKYNVNIDEDTIEDHLDTYRDWLHARSTCPNCKSTGVQAKSQQYRCLACTQEWRVNDAKTCALRRYSNTKTPA